MKYTIYGIKLTIKKRIYASFFSRFLILFLRNNNNKIRISSFPSYSLFLSSFVLKTQENKNEKKQQR